MSEQYLKIKIDSKSYGKSEVLRNIEFDVEKGEVISLMGASGSGKTTLARCLAGFEGFDGQIVLNGKDISHTHPKNRRVGIVPQDGALFPHLNVEGNIGFGIKDKKNRRDKVLNLLKIVELDEVESILTKKIDQLSGGQQQRVAVARALSSEPEVIILDESFTSLDQWLRITVRKQILDSIRKTETTVIVITHDISEAFELGDRIGIIENGELVQLGASEEIYERPKSLSIANLVGLTNVVSYAKAIYGDRFIDHASNKEKEISKILMLRPEHIVMHTSDSNGEVLKARMLDIKVNGPTFHSYLRLENTGELVISSDSRFASTKIGDVVDIKFLSGGILFEKMLDS